MLENSLDNLSIESRRRSNLLEQRELRFSLDSDLVVMARPFGMKYYNFKLLALNISKNGLFLQSDSKAHIPFSVGTVLNITFDFSSKYFGRPIHMVLEVVRLDSSDNDQQQFGTKIVSIEGEHTNIYFNILKGLNLAKIK